MFAGEVACVGEDEFARTLPVTGCSAGCCAIAAPIIHNKKMHVNGLQRRARLGVSNSIRGPCNRLKSSRMYRSLAQQCTHETRDLPSWKLVFHRFFLASD